MWLAEEFDDSFVVPFCYVECVVGDGLFGGVFVVGCAQQWRECRRFCCGRERCGRCSEWGREQQCGGYEFCGLW